MDESTLKSKLVAEWERTRPSWPILRHEDVRACGIPDISITGNNRTLWVEAKTAKNIDGVFKATGVQIETCKRLARAGRCVILLWETDGTWSIGSPFEVTRVRRMHYAFTHALATGEPENLVKELTWQLYREP